MPKVLDARPVDSRSVIEFAPGFFVPSNRADELAQAILANPDVADAIEEITAERCGDDGLTDDLCVYVPFWFLALVERQLANALYMKSLETAARARRVQSVFVSYGNH